MSLLQERRLKGGIPTQRVAAKALGVSESTVSKWENGQSMPQIDKLPAIARLYGCTTDELLLEITRKNRRKEKEVQST